MWAKQKQSGFTIVELLIVIVIIAILAAITIAAYNGIQYRSRVSEVNAGLVQAKKKLEIYKVDNSAYPTTGNLSAAGVTDKDVAYQYTSDGTIYCLTGTVGSVAYNITNSTSATEGVCSGHNAPSSGGSTSIANGDMMQSVTNANCPSIRTMVVDARDNRTYWVQKLADGNCWMLTNLAYAGGGTNTYNDVKALQDGTADGSTTYTLAKYYIPTGANTTTSPTQPSISTTGIGQYGYLYNWCAAMGAQTSTRACTSLSSGTTPNSSITICPSNWRIPTGNSGELVGLNNTVNNGSTSTDAGLRTLWLAQYGGLYSIGGFSDQSQIGYYWSSTIDTSNGAYAFTHYTSSYSVKVKPDINASRNSGLAIRCIAT